MENIKIYLADNPGKLLGDIRLYRGDSHPTKLLAKSNGVPVDLTGCSFLLTVSKVSNPDDINLQIMQVVGVIAADPLTGEFSFTPSSLQTDQASDKYYYDIQMIDAQKHVRTVAKRNLVILQDIGKSVKSSTEYSAQFTNDDLAPGFLTVNHDLGEMYPVVTVYNDAQEQVSVSPIPLDENNYTIDFGGPISGNWFVTTRVLAGRYTRTFTDADLDVSHVLAVTHGLGTAYPVVAVFNEVDEVSVGVKSTGTTSFEIAFGGAIAGTWHLTAI